MLTAVMHRGPDDGGFAARTGWSNGIYDVRHSREADYLRPQLGVLAFGNRRLSILDLSPAGHQPMSTDDGRYWIAYNGEVYNYIELRAELLRAGYTFHSSTDTEVVLKAYAHWGLNCFSRMNGMWGLAIWDDWTRQLLLTRDHFGIKPLYYALQPNKIVFASEIRPLFTAGISREPDLRSVRDFLLKGAADTGQHTFFKHITSVPPSSWIQIALNGDRLETRSGKFWTAEARIRNDRDAATEREELWELLKSAVQLRLRSDVPVGACLSGGLDSSAIVLLTKELLGISNREATNRIQTFSAIYPSMRHDEKPYIDAIVSQHKLHSHMTSPSGEDVQEALAEVVTCQEEPFASSGVISQWFVFRLAHQHGLKVMLDGQGADEILAGYPTFFVPLVRDAWRGGDYIQLARELVAAAWSQRHMRLDGRSWRDLETVTRRFTGAAGEPGFPPWFNALAFPANGDELPHVRRKFGDAVADARIDYLERHSLPGLLRYEDRNSMHFSIESRLPFLDPRLVEFAFSIPAKHLLRNGVTKLPLRTAAKRLLPEKITGRRIKLGFATPEDEWMRGALRPVIDDLLRSRSFASRGFVHPERLRSEWNAFTSAKGGSRSLIWRCVSLELWMRSFVDVNGLC